MYGSIREVMERVGVRRVIVVFVALVAVLAPRAGHPKVPLSSKAMPALVATLRPARPRRRFASPRPARPLPVPADDNGQAALTAIRRIARAVRLAGHDAQKRLGMTAAQLSVLRALDDPRPLCMNDLAERTMTNPSSVSEVVARLVSQGLVCRARNVQDGRSVELSLSDAGRSALANASGPDDQLRDCLDQMPPRQRRQLTRLLDRLLDKMTGPDSNSTPASAEKLALAPEGLLDAPPEAPPAS